MPRGGRRAGKPGTAYGNRSDLTQAPSAAPGQTYGAATAQLQAQKTAPLPQQPTPAAAGSAPAGVSPAGAAPQVLPGQLGPLHAPTNNPGQPITAGLTTGPGPGPEVLGGGGLKPVDEVRAMFAADPNDDMRRLVAYLDGY